MRFATIRFDNRLLTALDRDGTLVDLGALAHRMNPAFPKFAFPVGCDFIEAWEWENPLIRDVVERAAIADLAELPCLRADEVRHAPVVPDAGKVLAVGLNYLDHCREQNRTPPESPMLFSKLTTSLIGHRDPIVHWPITRELDYEGELAVVIGRGGRGIPESEALQHCFGFTILNDVSARDLQRLDRQWLRGKGLDTFGPVGPVVVTRDEVPDPQDLAIRTFVNETLYQDGRTSDMLFSVARLVAFASEAITLRPGDLLTTGTPAGVGVFASPPHFLHAGDRVRIVISRIGELVNPVVAPEPTDGRDHPAGPLEPV